MKNKLVFPVVLVVTLAFCFVFAACDNGSGGGGTYTVRYEISGLETVARMVIYINETGGTDQTTDVPIPWEKTITVGRHAAVGCSASLDFNNNSTYTAKIYINGKEKYSSSSSIGSSRRDR